MKKLLYLIFYLGLFGCNSDKVPSGIGDMQLSNDDKYIYFSYYDGRNASIFRVDSSGLNLNCIVSSKNDTSFYNPCLSKDNKKILFIGYANHSNNSSIYIANIDGSSIQRLTNGNEMIWDAFISEYNNEIIYCKATEETKRSPVGSSGAHGFDIFSLNLDNMRIKKISNLNAYQLGNMTELSKDSLLVYSYTNESGMFLFAKNNPGSLQRIETKSKSTELPNFYYQPLYSKTYQSYVFSNGYGLRVMDKSKTVRKTYDVPSPFIDCFCLYNAKARIFFTIEGDRCFYSINFDGTNLKKIEVKLPKRKL